MIGAQGADERLEPLERAMVEAVRAVARQNLGHARTVHVARLETAVLVFPRVEDAALDGGR